MVAAPFRARLCLWRIGRYAPPGPLPLGGTCMARGLLFGGAAPIFFWPQCQSKCKIVMNDIRWSGAMTFPETVRPDAKMPLIAWPPRMIKSLERVAPYLASRVPYLRTLDLDTPALEASLRTLRAAAKRALEHLTALHGAPSPPRLTACVMVSLRWGGSVRKVRQWKKTKR